MADPVRPVRAYVGKDGLHRATAQTSPLKNTTRAQVVVPPRLVIPIVFVPGIMGSNLKAPKEIKNPVSKKTVAIANERVWNVDSKTSAGGWIFKNPIYRQLVLNKDAVAVDDQGYIAQGHEWTPQPFSETGAVQLPTGRTPQAELSTDIARKRGWGTVSWEFYGEFLHWLQHQFENGAITDQQPNAVLAELMKLTKTTPPGATKPASPLTEEAIKKVVSIRFPVHAVGYNWLQSNLVSGQYLANQIHDKILATYNGINGQRCTQVIVVTHSMGGLVTRAAALAAESSILGVVHGVMPGDGAAAFYKVLAAGFDTEGGSWLESRALGNSAQDTTPIVAYNPGPLELAPNKRYNGGKPWLFIKGVDGSVLKALPDNGDPYKDIYAKTNVPWRALTPEWLNPAKIGGVNPITLYNRTLDDASKYHDTLNGRIHPNTYAHYSVDTKQKSWGTLIWEAEAGHIETTSPYGVGLQILGGFSSAPISYWSPDTKRSLGLPETWRFDAIPDGRERNLRDSTGFIRMRLLRPSDPGDATVPAAASAAQVGALPGCKIACAHDPGYEHSASYKTPQVRNTVLDAIIRLIETVKIN